MSSTFPSLLPSTPTQHPHINKSEPPSFEPRYRQAPSLDSDSLIVCSAVMNASIATPSTNPPVVPATTASHALHSLVASVLTDTGFDGADASVVLELERMTFERECPPDRPSFRPRRASRARPEVGAHHDSWHASSRSPAALHHSPLVLFCLFIGPARGPPQ